MPKPWFAEEPDDDLISEIKAFVRETGTPYLWRGHTHTKPEKGSLIRYKGEFTLPASHAGAKHKDKWSPCPCCKPRSPWFYKDGKIAWFPEQKLIRLIGPDCFKAIDAHGHAAALQSFREEQDRKNTERYLLDNIGAVPAAISAASENLPVLREIDRIRAILSRNVPRLIGFDLWRHVRADDALKLEVTRIEQRVDRSGNQTAVSVQDLTRYGPISGAIMLKPDHSELAPRAEKVIEVVRTINFGPEYAQALHHDERKEIIKKLRLIATLAEISDEADKARLFLSPLNMATLNGWGKSEGAPTRIYIAVSPELSEIRLGKEADTASAIPVKPVFFQDLRSMPAIAKSIKESN
ncbi:hypothetical protein CO675_39165 [Bradyrhizobium sp. C9]|nr:hypothetical protein CO675_39165 [Bradyrhizobium sp. C9]